MTTGIDISAELGLSIDRALATIKSIPQKTGTLNVPVDLEDSKARQKLASLSAYQLLFGVDDTYLEKSLTASVKRLKTNIEPISLQAQISVAALNQQIATLKLSAIDLGVVTDNDPIVQILKGSYGVYQNLQKISTSQLVKLNNIARNTGKSVPTALRSISTGFFEGIGGSLKTSVAGAITNQLGDLGAATTKVTEGLIYPIRYLKELAGDLIDFTKLKSPFEGAVEDVFSIFNEYFEKANKQKISPEQAFIKFIQNPFEALDEELKGKVKESFNNLKTNIKKNLVGVEGVISTDVGETFRRRREGRIATSAEAAQELAIELAKTDKEINKLKGSLKELIIVTGGNALKGGRSGLDVQRSLKGLTDKSQTAVINVENKFSDPRDVSADTPGSKKLFDTFYTGVIRRLEAAIVKGYNPDAIEIAAKAVAAKMKNPDIEINLVGYSEGGRVVEEAIRILKEIGIEAKGTGVGTPELGYELGLSQKEFEAFLGQSDLVRKYAVEQSKMFGLQGLPDKPSQNLENARPFGITDTHSFITYLANPEVAKRILGDPKKAYEAARKALTTTQGQFQVQDQLPKVLNFFAKDLNQIVSSTTTENLEQTAKILIDQIRLLDDLAGVDKLAASQKGAVKATASRYQIYLDKIVNENLEFFESLQIPEITQKIEGAKQQAALSARATKRLQSKLSQEELQKVGFAVGIKPVDLETLAPPDLAKKIYDAVPLDELYDTIVKTLKRDVAELSPERLKTDKDLDERVGAIVKSAQTGVQTAVTKVVGKVEGQIEAFLVDRFNFALSQTGDPGTIDLSRRIGSLAELTIEDYLLLAGIGFKQSGLYLQEAATVTAKGALTVYKGAEQFEKGVFSVFPLLSAGKAGARQIGLPLLAAGVASQTIPGVAPAVGGLTNLLGAAIDPAIGSIGTQLTTTLNGAIAETVGNLPFLGNQLATSLTGAIDGAISTTATATGEFIAEAVGTIVAGKAMIGGAELLAKKTATTALPGLKEPAALPPSTAIKIEQLGQATGKASQLAIAASKEAVEQIAKVQQQFTLLVKTLKPIELKALPPSTRAALPPAQTPEELQSFLEKSVNLKGLRDALKTLNVKAFNQFNREAAEKTLKELFAQYPAAVQEAVSKIKPEGFFKGAKQYSQASQKPKIDEAQLLEQLKRDRAAVTQATKLLDQLVVAEEASVKDKLNQLNDFVSKQLVNLKRVKTEYQIQGKTSRSLTGYESQLKELQKQLQKRIAENVGKGFVDGVKQQSQSVKNAAKEFTDNFVDTVEKEYEIQSPSKLALRWGKYIGQGFKNGVQEFNNVTEALFNSAKSLAKETEFQMQKLKAQSTPLPTNQPITNRREQQLYLNTQKALKQSIGQTERDIGAAVSKNDLLRITELKKQLAVLKKDLVDVDAAIAQFGKPRKWLSLEGLRNNLEQDKNAVKQFINTAIKPLTSSFVAINKLGDTLLKPLGLNLTNLTVLMFSFKLATAAVSSIFNQLQNVLFSFSQTALENYKTFERLKTTLTVIEGSVEGAGESFQFLQDVANKTSNSLTALSQSYLSLQASARGTALEGQPIKELFESVAIAARANNLSVDQTNRAYTALEQVLSKGTLGAEELRGQLSEALPGAFNIAARAIGVTTQQLSQMLEQGAVTADKFIPAFANQLKTEFAPALESANSTLDASIVRLQNSFANFQVANVGNVGSTLTPAINAASSALNLATANMGLFNGAFEVLIYATIAAATPALLKVVKGLIGIGVEGRTAREAIVDTAAGFAKLALQAVAIDIVVSSLSAYVFATREAEEATYRLIKAQEEADRARNKGKEPEEKTSSADQALNRFFNRQNLVVQLLSKAVDPFQEKLFENVENRSRGFLNLAESLATRTIVAESDTLTQNENILSRSLSLQSELKSGADVSSEAINEQVEALQSLISTNQQTDYLTDSAREQAQGQVDAAKKIIAALQAEEAAAKGVSTSYGELIKAKNLAIKQSAQQLSNAQAEISQLEAEGSITPAEAAVDRAKGELDQLTRDLAAQQTFINKLKEERGVDEKTGLPKDLTTEELKQYNETQIEITRLTNEQRSKRIEITKAEYDQRLDELDRYKQKALSAQEQAEQERLIQIQEALNQGVISQSEAERLKLDSTKERLTRELQIEEANRKQIETLDIPQIEREQRIRDSKLKTAQLTLQLLEQEREQQEKVRESLEAAQEKQHSNRLKQIDLQTQALSRQEEALERINKLAQAGADLAKAYNAAASASIDSQVARLDRIGELIDAVKPELSDVQQKAIAARQKRAAGEELRRQGFDPNRESLGQFELRMARERYQLEEKSRQLKLEAQQQEQVLARANLEIEKQKLVISQKRSQLEIEKELSELRRSKIEEQKNLRNAASDEERAAIQETLRLTDQEIANAQKRLSLLDEQYQQEQAILDVKEEQLRIEQESANQQLANEQQLARTKEQTEYFGKGGRAADLMPRRDYNAEYGGRQSITQLQQKYPSPQFQMPQMPDIVQGIERGNQPVLAKLDALINAVSTKVPQLNQTNTFVNQFANASEKELLRKMRSQTAEDVTNIVKGAVAAIA